MRIAFFPSTQEEAGVTQTEALLNAYPCNEEEAGVV